MGDGDRCQLWPVGKVLHVEDTLLISTRSVWNGLQFPCSFLFEHDSEVTNIASKQCCCVYISKWNMTAKRVRHPTLDGQSPFKKASLFGCIFRRS